MTKRHYLLNLEVQIKNIMWYHYIFTSMAKMRETFTNKEGAGRRLKKNLNTLFDSSFIFYPHFKYQGKPNRLRWTKALANLRRWMWLEQRKQSRWCEGRVWGGECYKQGLASKVFSFFPEKANLWSFEDRSDTMLKAFILNSPLLLNLSVLFVSCLFNL